MSVSPGAFGWPAVQNRIHGLVLAVLLFGFALPVCAQEDFRVTFYTPRDGVPAVGEIEFWASVESVGKVSLVILRVDGREVARFAEPPYRVNVDVGMENVEHRFEVIARGVEAEIGRALRTTPTLKVDEVLDLELRQLYVTVEGDSGRVVGLEREDFEILDNGDEQTIVTFERGDVPLTAVLLVDGSVSMTGAPLRSAVAGARSFMVRLQKLDEASLVLYSDRTLMRTPFLRAEEIRATSFTDVTGRGGTALNDQLYAALKTLESRQGRRVVILLSDGVDVHSALDAETVRWMMQRSQSVVYWVELREKQWSGVSSAWRDREGHDKELLTLRELVRESGGRVVTIESPDQIRSTFREILEELREQYVLGFYATENRNDGSWHRIKVKTSNSSLDVRTREGYWDAFRESSDR